MQLCVDIVVGPIMEGVSAVVQITPHEHVHGRIVEQSVYVVVGPIVEGVSAVVQMAPHAQGSSL